MPKSDSRYSYFHKFFRTLKKWEEEIYNYFEYGKEYTNAATEGVNSLIQEIEDEGRGYSFEVLRMKALYANSIKVRKKVASRKKPIYGLASGETLNPGYLQPVKREIIGYEEVKETVHGEGASIEKLLNSFKDPKKKIF